MNQDSLSQQIVLTVDTVQDQNDGSAINGLSLRDAIIQANALPTQKHIINLPSGNYNLSLSTDGSLNIFSNIEIIGASAGDTIISAGFLGDRIFNVFSLLTLANVTLQDANITGEGGAININAGARAIIDNTIIANNRTTGNGGGIANNGYLELNDSVVLLNTSNGDGGGIYTASTEAGQATAIINRSTIAFNSSIATTDDSGNTVGGRGGGICKSTVDESTDSILNVFNSTVSNNLAVTGGGIATGFTASADTPTRVDRTHIINSTIVQNQATSGSGIFSNPEVQGGASAIFGSTILINSIVADNQGGLNIQGTFDNTSSYNFIGSSSNSGLITSKNNQIGVSSNPLDPLLSDLPETFETTDGASKILVHSPLPNSPVINIGNNSAINIQSISSTLAITDQTQNARILVGTVDLGSVEYNNVGTVEDSLLNEPVYRFQNNQRQGTYLFTRQDERQNILLNYPQFTEEGLAFKVGIAPDDDLVAMYRFQNEDIPGTYLYTNAIERQSVLQNYPNFVEEGLAFYVYGADANQGRDIYRLQNTAQPGTYLFVTEAEKDNILGTYKNFISEGVAFEVNL